MSDKVYNALLWIKDILEKERVPYQIVGGLASRIHGGSRPVADIDLYIPGECSYRVLAHVDSYISKPLTHYVEGAWDLEYFQLIYRDQKIEIGLAPGTRILNRNNGEWVELKTDFGSSVKASWRGVELPLIPVRELIRYKSLLDREVDRIDIAELRELANNHRFSTNQECSDNGKD